MIEKIKPNILYIDDESINLSLFNLSFKKNYQIKLFTSSDEALKSISECSYEVIISDQRILLMNGKLFMVEARKISSNSKFILLTGYTDLENLERAINEIEICAFVKKPWDKKKLKIIIDKACLSFQKKKETITTKAALEQSIERLNIALDNSIAGVWDWNLISNTIYLSPEWKRMLGYKDDELENAISTLEGLLHPDDILKTFTHLDKYIYGKINRYEIEFRLKHKNGHFLHILARGNGKRDDNGKYKRITGTHINISDKYIIHDKIEKENKELEEKVIRRTQALRLLNTQLIQRIKFEHLITKISSDLVVAKSEEIDLKINYTLKEINNFAKADKSFLMQLDDRGNIFVSNEVDSKDNNTEIYNNFNGLLIENLDLLKLKIKKNDFIIIKDVKNITNEYELERDLLKKSNINSLIMFPLISDLGSLGYFGIAFNKTEREWNQEDISLLKFIGEILSNAISKSRNEDKILELEKCLSKANKPFIKSQK